MDKINFTVNGDHYSISGAEVSAHTSLNDFLRSRLQLFGTKAMCREGGCGACVVAAARAHPATGQREVIAVNSCLVAVLSCHEWEITTVEGIGGRRAGYHPAQQRLAERHGSQCGYCSPGWVMSMYSLQASGKHLDEYSLERSFAAHVCRCTGYRPILDTIKSFAHDSEGRKIEPLQDLEELDKLGCLRVSLTPSSSGEWCVIDKIPQDSAPLSLDLMRTEPSCHEFESNQAPARWYKPFTIADIFTICNREGPARCRFVAGNTASGLYSEDTETPIAIDISSVSELQTSVRDQNLVLGAGCTLTEVIATLRSHAQFPGFKYLTLLADHLSKVAHTPVRNVGTLGGNLAIKRAHPEFPSDVALLLQTVGATITLMESADRAKARDLFVPDFMKSRLRGSLIASVKLPPLSENCLLRTYKIMPRAQSTPALVNAGFLFEVEDAEHNVVKSASVVFSNMGAGCVQATNTERALLKRSLFKDDTLQAALRALKDELNPVKDPFDASPAFKKALALSLFYKAVLSLAPAGLVSARYLSGGADLVRGVSRGEQKFPTEKEMFPLTEPVPKLEALAQCAGEARYACDVPLGARALHAAFALADYGPAKIKAIDTQQAKAIPGVVEVLTARDIPGQNNFIPLDVPWQRMEEEILADKESKYDGQPVAIVVAVDRAVAEAAANAVKVQYADKQTPVLTVQDAMKAPDRDKRIIEEVVQEPTDRGTDVVHIIKGSYTVPGQYHFTMETQSCAAWPTENGVKLRSATQWMDMIQVAVSRALGIQENQVEIETGAVGGGYGGKASRSSMIACAAAVASHVLQRPVSLVLSLDANMRAVGSRQLCVADYEVGTNAAGLIQYVDLKYYSNCGHAFNDSAGGSVAPAVGAFYDIARWKLAGYSVLTDTAANTWCRAPSTTEANAIAEHIMERVAHAVGADPLAVRMLHVKSEHQKPINELVESLKKDSDWESRQAAISTYNSQNAWKKRALCISLMAYPIEHFGGFPVTVSVYHADGSVLAAHGGIEMGQGINTKLAQVISHELSIPYSTVRIRASDTFVSPNAMASNGSITSECVARAAQAACAELRDRVAGEGSWLERVKRAFDKEVNLKVVGMASGSSLASYSVYGACALEVELDALTGARNIRRVDLAQDTGRTLSPAIDIGQVEGALCMGLGLWGSAGERVRRNATGRLAATTWRYAPPGPLDIPEDLRITLRDADTGKNVAPVLRSKATGEPALVLAVSLTHALRAAAAAARAGLARRRRDDHDWLHIDVPCDVEHVLLAMDPQIENFKLK